MRIAEYETFDVPPQYKFIKITTEDGLVGWGEATNAQQLEAIDGAITILMDNYILGQDSERIEDCWQQMYRGLHSRRGATFMTAIGGIDQALWDIKGKRYEIPVHTLLGGRTRDRIRLYQHISISDDIGESDAADAYAREAARQVEAGFTAVKMTPTDLLRRIDTPAVVSKISERVAAVRDAVDNDVDICLDLHGKASKSMAKRLVTALESYDPMFYEEPVVEQGYADELPNIAERTDVAIAVGERRYSRWDFKSLFENHCIDVVQPDVCYAGGISETKRIAAMAEAYDTAIAPHCPLGPIALAACIQIDAVAPNALIQEQTFHRDDLRTISPSEYLDNPDVFDYDGEGCVKIPDNPGLGISIDEERVRELSGKDIETPHFVGRHDDGSVAEW